MSDIPVQVIVAAFQDENAANAVLKELQDAKKQGLIEIRDAAVLTKDPDGKLHIKDTKDWGFGKGAMAGGVVGIVAGLLAGPVGWGLLGGALIGGVAAKMADGGFDNKRLEQLGASLKPGSSAIVAVIDHVWVAQAEAIMKKQAMDTTTQAISDDVAKQLEEGRDVVYTAIGTSGAVAVERAAVGKDSAEMSRIVSTADGTVAEGVNVTKDAVTAGVIVATNDGVTGVIAEGTPVAADAAKAVTDGAQAATNTAQAAGDAAQAAGDAAKSA
jgi:uncharacterized membrane protein